MFAKCDHHGRLDPVDAEETCSTLPPRFKGACAV